nr:MAG TPA: hypothetical protein [Caudoviricetes sp.]
MYCQYNSYHLPDFNVRTIIINLQLSLLKSNCHSYFTHKSYYLRPTGLSFSEDDCIYIHILMQSY